MAGEGSEEGAPATLPRSSATPQGFTQDTMPSIHTFTE